MSEFNSNIKINTSDCIGCGQCAEICKEGAIKFQVAPGYAQAEINLDLCIACGACVDICPGEAIYEEIN